MVAVQLLVSRQVRRKLIQGVDQKLMLLLYFLQLLIHVKVGYIAFNKFIQRAVADPHILFPSSTSVLLEKVIGR